MSDIKKSINVIKQSRTYLTSEYIKKGLLDKSIIIEDCFDEAIQALQEKLERGNHQPLGLEEIKAMDGGPVWIEIIGKPDLNCWGYHDEDGVNGYTCFTSDDGYGKTWLAYLHKPKTEHIGEATNMVEPEWKKKMIGNFTKNH